MKRSLLLMAVAALALLVPTEASACSHVCVDVFGPCEYQDNTSTFCDWSGGVCNMGLCRSSSAGEPELLSAKYEIASIEIEHRNPMDTRDAEVRVAAKSAPEPVKTSLE